MSAEVRLIDDDARSDVTPVIFERLGEADAVVAWTTAKNDYSETATGRALCKVAAFVFERCCDRDALRPPVHFNLTRRSRHRVVASGRRPNSEILDRVFQELIWNSSR